MADNKQRTNFLGVLGWMFGGSWGIERYAYTLHRITGIGLVFFFVIHICVTSLRFLGKAFWETQMHVLNQPVFKIGEFLVYIAFCFHGLNGVRLILIELGFIVGKPERPVFPYTSSIARQRIFFFISMAAAGIFMLLGGYTITRGIVH